MVLDGARIPPPPCSYCISDHHVVSSGFWSLSEIMSFVLGTEFLTKLVLLVKL